MDAAKELATKTDKDTAAEAVATEATGGTPELPDVADYIKPEVAEQLGASRSTPSCLAKGLIYLASFPKSGTPGRVCSCSPFNPMVRDDLNFNLSDIAGRAGQMDVTFQLFERIWCVHYEISDQKSPTMPLAQAAGHPAGQKGVRENDLCTAPGTAPGPSASTSRSAVYIAQPARRVPVRYHEHRTTA